MARRRPRWGLLAAVAAGLVAAGAALALLAGAFAANAGHRTSHQTGAPKPVPPANPAAGTVSCSSTACTQGGTRVQAPIEDGSCSEPTGRGLWTRIDATGQPLLACVVNPPASGTVGAIAKMPDVIRGRLDLTQGYLEGAGLSHKTLGGGMLRGIIDDSNFEVCATDPPAGARVVAQQKVKLFVDRSC